MHFSMEYPLLVPCCSLVLVSLHLSLCATGMNLLFGTVSYFVPYILDFILFQCAESALKSVIGGLNNTYFVGNAPMAHMVVEQTDSSVSTFKVPISVSRNQFILLHNVRKLDVIQFLDIYWDLLIASWHWLLHCSI